MVLCVRGGEGEGKTVTSKRFLATVLAATCTLYSHYTLLQIRKRKMTKKTAITIKMTVREKRMHGDVLFRYFAYQLEQ